MQLIKNKFQNAVKLSLGFLIAVFFGNTANAQSGCTDPLANNFDAAASINDGSCTYNAASAPISSSTQLSSTLNENSGLLLWDDTIWTHNDGGNPEELYAIAVDDLANFSTLSIPGVTNVDWEDIAQDETFVYLGDFGNNTNGNRTDLKIYRITKASIIAGTPVVDVINFSYEDQTDFTPTGGNNTDFDCEALIATDTNLFLFTKEWVSEETTVYALPKTPGTYSATNQGSFNVNGLITGATYVDGKQLVAFSGYEFITIFGFNVPSPFIYILYDFQNNDFFGGNKRRLSFSGSFPQIEGITTRDGLNYYVSNERSSGSGVTINPNIHEVNLNAYLLDYLGYETSANATVFSSATSWVPGVVPPTNEDIIVSSDLNLDQNYIAKSLQIDENATFRVADNNVLGVEGDLINNGVLYFESNSVGTAQFDEFSGTISGNGQVIVERYIPASNRAFRYLSTPVASSGTIKENWQQNGLNPSDADYEPNLGTHITGPGGAANGFDPTQTNNPSLYTFSNSNQFYEIVPNTSATGSILENNTPYTLFVRGDRSIALTSNTSTPTNTRLKTTGPNADFLTGGPITTALNQTNDAFSLVANPYQAVVDFDLATKTNLRADIIVYNPALGTNGQFVTLTSNRFIQPGQSFWVQNDTDVSDPVGGASIAFEEADKNTAESSSVGVFSEEAVMSLNLELYNENDHLLDILQFKFQSGGNNVYGNDDMGKILGSSENLCAVNANTLLSVERRDLPQEDDVIPLHMSSYQGTDYVLKFVFENWDAGVNLVLTDHYLNTASLADPNEAYVFTVDSAIPESMANDRFSLRFDIESLSNDEFIATDAIVLYPNPTVANDLVQLSIPSDKQGQPASFELYGVNGKLLFTKAYPSLNPVEQLDLSSFAAGLYILKVKVDGGIQSFKLSKL